MNIVQQSVRHIQRGALPLARLVAQITPKSSVTFTKHFSAQAARRNGVENALFASGESVTSLQQTLQSLVGPGGRWTLTHDGTGIQRHFQFKSFKAAWVRSSCIQSNPPTFNPNTRQHFPLTMKISTDFHE